MKAIDEWAGQLLPSLHLCYFLPLSSLPLLSYDISVGSRCLGQFLGSSPTARGISGHIGALSLQTRSSLLSCRKSFMQRRSFNKAAKQ